MKENIFNENLKDGNNYYSIIIAVAKMARKIVDLANEISGTCPDDPVGEAIENLKSGEYEIVIPEDLPKKSIV